MSFPELLIKKRNQATKIKNDFSLLKKYKINGLIILSNNTVLEELIEGLSVLDANFVVITDGLTHKKVKNICIINDISEEFHYGFDFVVGDNELLNLNHYFAKGVVPLMPKKNFMSSILKEFNPMKSEGNSFLYDADNKWSIFYAITRYLENCKFPYDKKNLVKNVFEI